MRRKTLDKMVLNNIPVYIADSEQYSADDMPKIAEMFVGIPVNEGPPPAGPLHVERLVTDRIGKVIDCQWDGEDLCCSVEMIPRVFRMFEAVIGSGKVGDGLVLCWSGKGRTDFALGGRVQVQCVADCWLEVLR